MKIFFHLLFFSFSNYLFSQKTEIDSLLGMVKNCKHDTDICTVYLNIFNYCENADIYKYAKTVISISQKNLKKPITDKEKLFFINCQIITYNNLGYYEYFNNKYIQALNSYHKALKIAESLKDKKAIAELYNNIGGVYNFQKENGIALKYYLASLKIREELKITNISLLNNIGTIYNNEKKWEEGLTYFNKCLELIDTINQKAYYASLLSNLSLAQLNLGDVQTAYKNQSKSLKMRIEMGDKLNLSKSLYSIASIYDKMKDIDKTTDYAMQALKLSQEIGNIQVIKSSAELLSKIYESQNKSSESLKMYKLFIQTRDSIDNVETEKMLIKTNEKYFYEKKSLASNLLMQSEKKVIQLELAQKQKQQYYLYAGILVVALFGGFMFNRFKVTKKQNNIISTQKEEVEHQKNIIEVQQKETTDSINYAKRIQNTLLANKELLNTYLPNYYLLFKPKDIVSGDFYWATEHNKNLYLAVCDSTGHGVPGAFMSLLNIGFLNEAIKQKNIEQPHEILNYVRARLIESLQNDGQQDGMDATLIKINLATNNRIIEYAAANNEPLLIRNNEIIKLQKDKMPVGKGIKENSFTLHTINTNKGDGLYLFTDGIADQFGGDSGKKLMSKKLKEFILSTNQLPMETQKTELETYFENWKGNLKQIDDVCIIGIKF